MGWVESTPFLLKVLPEARYYGLSSVEKLMPGFVQP
jgi:hypothetical protein